MRKIVPKNSLEKYFDEWNIVKCTLHCLGKIPQISEGEIYWCGIGENIGVEINGKNAAFSRPVLIFRKLSRFGFVGIPLTSKEHNGSWYVSFEFKGRHETAILAQVRNFSVFRLYDKMGRIAENDMAKIRQAFIELYK